MTKLDIAKMLSAFIVMTDNDEWTEILELALARLSTSHCDQMIELLQEEAEALGETISQKSKTLLKKLKECRNQNSES